jgi:hypothetical protein
MKNTIIFPLIFILILIGCKKDGTSVQIEQLPPDEILFQEINKTITASQIDSISGSCKDLRFEIRENLQGEFNAILSYNGNYILCDGYSSILTDPQTETAFALENNVIISKECHWYSGELNLNHFAGLGEKYLGYRSCGYPDGIERYGFGWIKIELTPNGDTLKILSRANNRTTNNPIKAGQIE